MNSASSASVVIAEKGIPMRMETGSSERFSKTNSQV